jgi:pre-mRNA-splicing factor SPF27
MPDPLFLYYAHTHQQQTQYGTELNKLESRWTQLISETLQIEMANVAVDMEIDRLNKREAELASAM